MNKGKGGKPQNQSSQGGNIPGGTATATGKAKGGKKTKGGKKS